MQSAARHIRLLGLDFGSTTSSALLAEARLGGHSVSGRVGFSEPRVLYRSPPVFTPFNGDGLDEPRLTALLDGWLRDCGLEDEPPFAGAALVTGLAAQQRNVATLTRLIEARIGDNLMATADDPGLESWLAFMGNCGLLSRAHPDLPILNLDIGGGTSNPAVGLDGNVLACGCHFIGARHWRFAPGSYCLQGCSEQGKALLEHLGIACRTGAELSTTEVERLVGWQVSALEALVSGDEAFFATPIGRLHEQLPLRLPALPCAPAITFSGGVGELIYAYLEGAPWPATTAFGDLGIDLAQAILASPLLGAGPQLLPQTRGRATVQGLTLHSCEVSGSSLYLPDARVLPLRDLPIIARLPLTASSASLASALDLVRYRPQGACLQLLGASPSLAALRKFAEGLRDALQQRPLPAGQPLVLLLEANAGKTLGHYASDWGRLPQCLLVVDEIPPRAAQFIHIGRPHQQMVPVSFFGLE
ncbi:MAG: ethanolamine ammonia-lyase reactivating factor EutA [Gammaproteobacteria bacterium]|nr:ethanolamine ammonia-lyase reactivating factor EutA [Gammaproteobacteria bacterium]MBU1491660.1 ethanolamine ammonia-lyase reactivating factor EutA [Gammaproteobacteria bacterium]MBU2140753.1 ethanolamine ammonia-lyase reactivating factor EutA [Gammaproteobacteria bacterium]MBU2215676.1 ethanolamine ammonia-lyase reactivating factor EutA [Gammaproteobacteria bacterium]